VSNGGEESLNRGTNMAETGIAEEAQNMDIAVDPENTR
jgi:hypothetical protein